MWGSARARDVVIVVLSLLFSLGACQVHFDCPPLPPLQRPARNVYELRPQDIKVVMALGDSITAGMYVCMLHAIGDSITAGMCIIV